MNVPIPPELRPISDEACRFVRSKRLEIVERFAGDAYAPDEIPISIFMAGSPGAGKTEYSKALLTAMQDTTPFHSITRIDGDEIRSILPGYTGTNSYLFQPAISLAINKIQDYALKNSKSFILDGTFSEFQIAKINVQRSIDRGRIVILVYIFQDPETCWRFTQKREKSEGRNIPKDIFIEQLYASKNVAQNIKNHFGDRVHLWVIEKDLKVPSLKAHTDVSNIDEYVHIMHTKSQLARLL